MRLYTADALLPGASAEVVHQGGVLIDGGQIVAAGPSEALRPMGPGAEVVDLGAVTLLPGLIDAHVHLGFDGSPDPAARMRAETDAEQLVLMRSSARQLLHAGVTTARDLGARAFLDIAVRDAIARGTADGPRLVTAGRPLTPAGGHCWFMGGECGSAGELRRMVRLHHLMGADLIKVMSTGGFMTTGSAPWSAQFTLAELSAVTGEAHRLGKRVAAHAHGKEGIARAVAAGVDTIEHCSFAGPDGEFGSDFDPALAEEIAVAGIFVCPTINVTAPVMRERHGPVLEEVIMGLHQHRRAAHRGHRRRHRQLPARRLRLRAGGAGGGRPAGPRGAGGGHPAGGPRARRRGPHRVHRAGQGRRPHRDPRRPAARRLRAAPHRAGRHARPPVHPSRGALVAEMNSRTC